MEKSMHFVAVVGLAVNSCASRRINYLIISLKPQKGSDTAQASHLAGLRPIPREYLSEYLWSTIQSAAVDILRVFV